MTKVDDDHYTVPTTVTSVDWPAMCRELGRMVDALDRHQHGRDTMQTALTISIIQALAIADSIHEAIKDPGDGN